jgi:phosphoglycerol transferase
MILTLIAFTMGVLLLCKVKTRTPGRYLTALAVFLFGIYSAAYFATDAITGHGIDQAAFFYVTYGMEGAGYGAYTKVIAETVSIILFGLVLSLVVYRSMRGGFKSRAGFSGRVVGYSALAVSFMVHPASLDLANLVSSHKYEQQLGMFNFYRSPRITPQADNPPNLVVIYAESLERTYFDETRFPGLITGLKELEQRSESYTEIQQLVGTGWTIAGITASQCGVPLITTGAGGNSMDGLDRFLPGATCLGDLLSTAGYRLSYLGGASLQFGGKGKFFTTHGFDQVEGREELIQELKEADYLSDWGIYDDSLMDIAYDRFVNLSAANEKFGLFLLTLDTHHPDGHLSRACQGSMYGDGSNPMLNAVACSDRIISDFVNRILDSEYAQNTLIVIVSDHLAIQNRAWELLNKNGERARRNLFMVLGPGRIKPGLIAKPGSTLDIGPTILGHLDLDTSYLGLGRSLLSEEPTLMESFKTPEALSANILGWKDDLVGLWKMPTLGEYFEVDPDRRKVQMAEQTLSLPMLIELDDQLNTKKVMFPEYFDPALWGYVSRLPLGSPFMWIDQCRNVRVLDDGLPGQGLCLFAGKMGKPAGLSLIIEEPMRVEAAEVLQGISGEAETAYHRQLVSRFRVGTTEIHSQTIKATGSQTEEVVLRSVGFPGWSSEFIGSRSGESLLHLYAGINLVGVVNEKKMELLANVNPFLAGQIQGPEEPFYRIMERRADEFQAFAVVIHETAFLKPTDLTPVFQRLPLEKWKNLEFRQPYIGFILPGAETGNEYVGDPESVVALQLGYSEVVGLK